jgi:hypothetical protein
MNRHWFIYYRVNPYDLAAAVAEVREFQAVLKQRFPGLQATLMRRPEPRDDGLITLMETYAVEATPLENAQTDWPRIVELAARPLAPLVQSARHVEEFVPCV